MSKVIILGVLPILYKKKPIINLYKNLAKEYLKKPYNQRDSGFGLFKGISQRVRSPPCGIYVSCNPGVRAIVKNEKGDYLPFYLYPRSSTFKYHGLTLVNSTGIIDRGYRGPIYNQWTSHVLTPDLMVHIPSKFDPSCISQLVSNDLMPWNNIIILPESEFEKVIQNDEV